MSAPASPLHFDESAFQARVNKALERVRTILDTTRLPQFPADVPHTYDDKYLLAEFLVNATVASTLNVLSALGVSEKQLAQLQEWSRTRSVTVRLKAQENCKFLRKVEREVKSDTKYVSESTLFGKRESYAVTKITEWFWQFDVRYELLAFQGNEPEKNNVVLQHRHGTVELKTTTEPTPKPASTVRNSVDLNLTWLLQQLDASHRAGAFRIDRLAKSCHTPRRNVPVDGAMQFLDSANSWAASVHSYFSSTLFPTQENHGLDLSAMSSVTSVFVPVQPLFEKAQSGGSGVLPAAQYLAPFLAEQQRSIAEKFKELERVYPANDKLITQSEAKLVALMYHLQQLCQALCEGLDYIEDMLFKQLVAAIGKEVTPMDFNAYMRYHARKLYRAEYQPRPFCFAIRRPDHTPEGVLSIEAQQHDGSLSDPVQTIVAWAPATRPMRFALDAATDVRFGGDRFLHGLIQQQFSGSTGVSLSLTARARQFSSFIVLIGTILSADSFDPKYGIIIQNKDDLRVPLLLETIPSAKEFRDAIESLSPEQQRFAKAYRAMQLESTLFGVCVIQIKPQLERLLNLPADALTKEIKLTQDLMSLFIEYQVPSDLLSYEGDEQASVGEKLSQVKQYVAAMQDTIKKNKDTGLAHAQLEQDMRFAEDDGLALAARDQVEMKKSEKSERSESMKKKSGGGGMMHAFKRLAAPSAAAPARSSHASHAVAASVVVHAPSSAGSTGTSTGTASTTTATKTSPQPTASAGGAGADITSPAGAAVDYTKIPAELEAQFEELDNEGACRPTIIKPGSQWTKRFQKTLLAAPESKTVSVDDQGLERQRCVDLLDALTKSGSLSIESASLHVVIASTHCFAKTLMNTVVQDNVNPIEKLERSLLIVASTVHQVAPAQLITDEHRQRVAQFNPQLIPQSQAPQPLTTANITVSVAVAKK